MSSPNEQTPNAAIRLAHTAMAVCLGVMATAVRQHLARRRDRQQQGERQRGPLLKVESVHPSPPGIRTVATLAGRVCGGPGAGAITHWSKAGPV